MNSIGHYQNLKNCGSLSCSFNLPEKWKVYVQNAHYDQLYQEIEAQLPLDKELGQQISALLFTIYGEQKQWKYDWMLALREGPQEEEQEGIWHDDASRDLALSLSLNLKPELIQGGELRMRPRANRDKVTTIGPRPWGHGHLFATGKWDWEHKTSRVTSGNRLILVVWITLTP